MFKHLTFDSHRFSTLKAFRNVAESNANYAASGAIYAYSRDNVCVIYLTILYHLLQEKRANLINETFLFSH